MPPRKRAAVKPPEPDSLESAAPEADAEVPEVPTPVEDADVAEAVEPTAENPAEEAAPDETPEAEPQAEDGPCPICVPGGWADGVTAVGCEHGHWTREATG